MSLDPAKIVSALSLPGRAAVACEANWPLILAALDEFKINTDMVQVAAAATCMVEAGGFTPIKEIHASKDRQPALWATQERYWQSGCYGRGLVMTTWPANYAALEKALGIPFTTNPDLLLVPANAARALAHYFATTHVAANANARNWRGVRIGVNGGTNGMEPFMDAVDALLEVV